MKILHFTNQWPAKAFIESVEDAVKSVMLDEPGADPDTVRNLILFQWLAFSQPAGSA